MSAWKSKEVYTFKLFPLHNLSPIIKYFNHNIGLRFNNFVLLVEKIQLRDQNYKCLHCL